jgi:hypothetical protein
MSADSSQRARVSRDEKTERIRHITRLMASGHWVTGVTGPELADEWGVAVGTVEGYSAEASRFVREAIASSDDIRAQILATLQSITSEAMHRGQLRTAVESVKALAGVAGVEAPKKVDVGGSLAEFLSLGLAPGGSESDKPVEE